MKSTQCALFRGLLSVRSGDRRGAVWRGLLHVPRSRCTTPEEKKAHHSSTAVEISCVPLLSRKKKLLHYCTFRYLFGYLMHKTFLPFAAIIPTEQQMSPAEVRRKSISLDCDTIYFSDVLGSFRAVPSGCGSSFYFEDEGDKVMTTNMAISNQIDTFVVFPLCSHELLPQELLWACARICTTGWKIRLQQPLTCFQLIASSSASRRRPRAKAYLLVHRLRARHGQDCRHSGERGHISTR